MTSVPALYGCRLVVGPDYIKDLMVGYPSDIVEYALDEANLLISWPVLGFFDADEIRSAMLNGFPVEDNR
jgi:hypothetical protein